MADVRKDPEQTIKDQQDTIRQLKERLIQEQNEYTQKLNQYKERAEKKKKERADAKQRLGEDTFTAVHLAEKEVRDIADFASIFPPFFEDCQKVSADCLDLLLYLVAHMITATTLSPASDTAPAAPTNPGSDSRSSEGNAGDTSAVNANVGRAAPWGKTLSFRTVSIVESAMNLLRAGPELGRNPQCGNGSELSAPQAWFAVRVPVVLQHMAQNKPLEQEEKEVRKALQVCFADALERANDVERTKIEDLGKLLNLGMDGVVQ